MSVSEKEALASIRVLIAVAKADGHLAPEERTALEGAISALELPVSVDKLIAEDNKLDDLLKQITSAELREQTYQSAYGLAHADGNCDPAEQVVLDKIKASLAISEAKVSLTRRMMDEAKDTFLPSNIQAISDPVKRAAEIKEDVTKYSIMGAILGAFPVPGLAIATDLAAVALQVKMVRDIGQYYGQVIDKGAAKSLLAAMGIGTGARIAVTNIAKLVPGFGSAVGAVATYAATYALGKVAVNYFENGMKVDFSILKIQFKDAEKEGKKQYEANKAAIEAKKKANEAKIKSLGEDLKAGKITQEEYTKQVEALV